MLKKRRRRRGIIPPPGPAPVLIPPNPFPNRLLPAGRRTPISAFVGLRQRGPLANARNKQGF
jgi:hypothetical protein